MLILDNIPEIYHEKFKSDFEKFVKFFNNVNLIFIDNAVNEVYTIDNYKNIYIYVYQYNKIEINILKILFHILIIVLILKQ